jgi:competence ComEA-like helix-hairpin-helix protein
MKKYLINIRRVIGEYLTYNKSEQRGIFVLTVILLVLIVANSVIPSGTFQKAPDISVLSREVALFEAAWQKAADSDSMARVSRYTYNRYKPYVNKSDTSFKKFNAVKPQVVVDLNSADTFDLQQLRGIGPGYARRIVSYREKLRGYNNKNQLLEVFGMDSARFASIRENVTVNQDSIHPIDLNTVTFKELLRHPYFPFPITKNIMLYKQKHKSFKSLEELKNVEGINDSLYRRMIIYLRLSP